jgi:hypothetical protein
MRKTLGFLTAVMLIVVWSGAAWSGDDADPRAIVTQAIKAMGGEKNLATHNAATWTEKGTYYGMGEGLPFTGKYAARMPDHFRMEIEGVFTIVFTGDKGWIHAGGDTKEMTEEQFAVQKNDHRAGWIATVLPLKDKAFALTALPEIKVDDQPAAGIKVARKEYPEVKLYFDKKTHLLVKSEWRTKSSEEKFKEVTAESYYSKYQEIDGAQVSTRMVMKRDGKPYVEADVMDYKAAGKLDDSVFAKP